MVRPGPGGVGPTGLRDMIGCVTLAQRKVVASKCCHKGSAGAL